jgi:hypothetical protein
MINVELFKLDRTGVHCSNINCKRNPQSMVNILGDVWYIKVDTTVVMINLGGSRAEYYCRDCIDDILHLIKSKLDSKLWAFH